MAHHRLSRRASVALALALVACGTALPKPTIGAHPAGATTYVSVPYPPPPARVEEVPAKPRADAVWLDGEWTWQSRRWVWEPGRWLAPPKGAFFAPWVAVRLDTGDLMFAPGTWYSAAGAPIAPPAPIVVVGDTVTAPGEDALPAP